MSGNVPHVERVLVLITVCSLWIDKRKAEAERIRQKYQDRIPVSLVFPCSYPRVATGSAAWMATLTTGRALVDYGHMCYIGHL